MSRPKPKNNPPRGPKPATLPHADKVLAAKIAGKTTAEIAASIGEHRTTLSRWLNAPEQLARMAQIRAALQAESQVDLLRLWEANIRRIERQMETCTTAAEGGALQAQMEQLLRGSGSADSDFDSGRTAAPGDQVSFTLREAVMQIRQNAGVAPAQPRETIDAYAQTPDANE